MHTQQFESVADKYNRDLRARRLKRALAWCGVVAAGSLLVFAIGATLINIHTTLKDLAIICTILFLFVWGLWGAVFLTTRH